MAECKDTCLDHSGHEQNIREFCEFKRSMTKSGIGTIDRIWTGIEKKASKRMLVTFCVVVITLVTTLFGLVYNSNKEVLHEMVGIKSSIQLINEKLE